LDFEHAPAAQGAQTHAPASPRTQRAFQAAAAVSHVFPPLTTIHAASSTDPDSFGATTAFATPLVELNRQAHGGATRGLQQVRATQTAIHELVVHAQYEAAGMGGTAEQEHRRMFLAPDRSAPNSYLAATQQHIRANAGNRARQREIIADYDRDVTTEMNAPENRQNTIHQQLSGAAVFHRNRVNSMEDAIAPQPGRQHDW
jgi:hypothetical protein